MPPTPHTEPRAGYGKSWEGAEQLCKGQSGRGRKEEAPARQHTPRRRSSRMPQAEGETCGAGIARTGVHRGLESQGDEWAAVRTAAETETGYWKADNSARMAQAEDEPDHWEEAWLWEPGRRGFKTPLSHPLAIPLLPVPKR